MPPSGPPSRRQPSIRCSPDASICDCKARSTAIRALTGAGRADELLERVGLTDAADRKVGGYSGGMKRRLDLALALVHGPQILFLDEPTTGLDIQSRTALWEEVGRLAKDEGVTVFLTTQYLEEADVLADRSESSTTAISSPRERPTSLKAEIGRPRLEVIPERPTTRMPIAAVLAQFGEPTGGWPRAVAVRLAAGAEDLAEIVRALDAKGLRRSQIQIYSPSLDDVFLAKTGHSLEGDAEDEEPKPAAA